MLRTTQRATGNTNADLSKGNRNDEREFYRHSVVADGVGFAIQHQTSRCSYIYFDMSTWCLGNFEGDFLTRNCLCGRGFFPF